ncbi:MAG: hypothetical protein ACP5ON_11030 [Bacteroidota bacterium]
MNGLDPIIRGFTRFFIPGMSFLIFSVLIPLLVCDGMKNFKEMLNVQSFLVLSVILGYVLDSIRAYRWTFSFSTYVDRKNTLVNELRKFYKQIDSNKPDHYLATLWAKDEKTYNRLYGERSEWFMILEISFSLLIGGVLTAVALIVTFLGNNFTNWYFFFLPFVLLLVSWISSKNGIDRMIAHDQKLLKAL